MGEINNCGKCVRTFDCDARGCLLAIEVQRTPWPTDEHFDLMVDEFTRISKITESDEIKQLCDRAINSTEQHVPVIKQRNDAITKLIQVGIWLHQLPETPEIVRIIREINAATSK